jgi:hypothetical protein
MCCPLTPTLSPDEKMSGERESNAVAQNTLTIPNVQRKQSKCADATLKNSKLGSKALSPKLVLGERVG